jgi:triphosphatase
VIPVVAGSNPVGHPNPVAAALVQIEHNAPHACSSPDPEYLHQLRVGLRRLRAIVPRDVLRADYSRVRGPLGRARDWDVFTAWLEGRHAPQSLLRRARAARQEAHARARRVLSSRTFTRLIETARTLAPLRRSAVGEAHRKTLRQAARMRWASDAALHELRIRARRERYIWEAFAACFDARSVRAFTRRLKALQDTLGELNDLRVARRLLRQIGFHAPLDLLLEARRAALLSALPRVWAAYAAAQTPRPRASAARGAGARARALRGRFPPRRPAVRPAAGDLRPAR